jgi:hypothetical protein
VNPAIFSSLEKLIALDAIPTDSSLLESFLLAAESLGNVSLARFFFNLIFRPRGTALPSQLSLLMPLPLPVVTSGALALVSVDTLSDLLSSGEFVVESEDSLTLSLLALAPEYFPLLEHIEMSNLTMGAFLQLVGCLDHSLLRQSHWSQIIPELKRLCQPFLDSLIISKIPEIWSQFFEKRFRLLWRGTRDGFGSSAFHDRCDGHGPTLTVIQDTNGNVFGGFTDLAWESRVWNYQKGGSNNCWKGTEETSSFIYSLKNPSNTAPILFPLKRESYRRAIRCSSTLGPSFGRDIAISDECHMNSRSFTGGLGSTYENAQGFDAITFLSGSKNAMVREIEVFEIEQ